MRSSVIRGLEDHDGILRWAAGEMNAEISRMFLEGSVNCFAILAMSYDAAFAQRRERVQLVVGYQ